MFSVRVLTPELEPAYADFWRRRAADDESVLAYHHLAYREVLRAALGPGAEPRYLVAVDGDGAVRAALPLFVGRAALGTAFCSLPFFGPNAGVVCAADDPAAPALHRLLLGGALAQAEREGAWSLSVYTPLRAEGFGAYEEVMGGLYVEKLTQHMALRSPPAWSGKIAYDVRRAERAGLRVVEDPGPEHVEQFWTLYRDNCAEYGIPLKPRACLDACLAEMLPRGLGHFLVAVDPAREGRVVAGLLNLCSPRTVSYYMPAYDARYRADQPMALLIDRAAAAAAGRGATLWNWEASPGRESGVYRYKARWGSAESGYRIYVRPLRPVEELAAAGREAIAAAFPFFFVYPFDRLPAPAGAPA